MLPIVFLRRCPARFAALSALLAPAPLVFAQDAPTTPPAVGVSPEAAPASDENALPAAPLENAPDAATPDAAIPETAPDAGTDAPSATEEAGVPTRVSPVGRGSDLPAPATPPSRLFASEITKNGDLIVAQGSPAEPVRFETSAGKLTAQRVQLDIAAQTVAASGSVHLERQTLQRTRELRARGLTKRFQNDSVTETLVGQNLRYDFKNQTGTLDDARLQLAALSVSTDALLLNGRRYTARGVIIRPGARSEADRKIYGTPPLSIRAKTLTATAGQDASGDQSVLVRGGGLYFRNTRILPLPAYVFRAGLSGGQNDQGAFDLTPGISFNSADRVLVTTRLSYALSKEPGRLDAFVDAGLSQRVGLRGGVGVESRNELGSFVLRARHSDVVETQLTNRIELDRAPELTYSSPSFATFALPGGRRGGFSINTSYGRYTERRIGDDEGATRAARFYGRLLFTTRLRAVDGPFLRLFATNSRYSGAAPRYNSRGFEIGYDGDLLPRVRGQVSYRSTSLRGDTPFRFDEIEIARELRSTFDVTLTPRYLLPIDLRYDLSRRTFRDKTFGLLRSYRTFAYGVVYQQARRDLRLEVRQGF